MDWTEAMDNQLRAAREEGLPWDAVGALVGVDRQVCIKRAKVLNLPTAARSAPGTAHTQTLAARRAARRA